MNKKIKEINDVANECGYFYNAYLKYEINVNNGYNCQHPKQENIEIIDDKEIGKCFPYCCPLGYEADKADFIDSNIDNQGYEYEEDRFVVIDN